ncbi:YtxH domain-containing protein, partial [Enterococcus faecalis]
VLSTSTDSNNGEDREKIVAEEIEDRNNVNMTITKTINRLGTVFFLFVFNMGIFIFVFLLTGIMIFLQVLFIIYAMFLPVSFILSMIPS